MSLMIKQVAGGAFYLPGNDIDTDRIIPARYLKCVTFEGLGNHVFEDDRAQLKGMHPFDLPENRSKSILVADANFGSGSSREHAVPALTQRGIKAIIGLSFAAIFRGNAVGNGLVCVEVSPEYHANLTSTIHRVSCRGFNIDLEKMKIEYEVGPHHPRPSIPCTMPESHREMLTTGTWDSLATALEAGILIEQAGARLPYLDPVIHG